MSDALQLLGVAVTALATLTAAVFMSRQARQAARDQSRIDSRRTDAQIQNDLITRLRTEVNELRDDRNEDRDEFKKRIEQLERKGHEDRDSIEDTNRRLDDAMRRYQSAIRYIRELLAFIAAHAPGQKAPAPPADLLPDFDGG